MYVILFFFQIFKMDENSLNPKFDALLLLLKSKMNDSGVSKVRYSFSQTLCGSRFQRCLKRNNFIEDNFKFFV